MDKDNIIAEVMNYLDRRMDSEMRKRFITHKWKKPTDSLDPAVRARFISIPLHPFLGDAIFKDTAIWEFLVGLYGKPDYIHEQDPSSDIYRRQQNVLLFATCDNAEIPTCSMQLLRDSKFIACIHLLTPFINSLRYFSLNLLCKGERPNLRVVIQWLVGDFLIASGAIGQWEEPKVKCILNYFMNLEPFSVEELGDTDSEIGISIKLFQTDNEAVLDFAGHFGKIEVEHNLDWWNKLAELEGLGVKPVHLKRNKKGKRIR
jgi:hypothetical protein